MSKICVVKGCGRTARQHCYICVECTASGFKDEYIPPNCEKENCNKPSWNTLDSPYCKPHTMEHYYPDKHSKTKEPTTEELIKILRNDELEPPVILAAYRLESQKETVIELTFALQCLLNCSRGRCSDIVRDYDCAHKVMAEAALSKV